MTSLILLLSLSFFPQAGGKWETLAPKASGFAVEMPPGERQQSDTPFGSPAGSGTMHQILIGTDDLYCDLRGYEHQRPIARAELKRVLDWARDQQSGPGRHGKVIAEKEVKLGAVVGREFTLEDEFSKMGARGRAFVRGSTVYVLVASSRKGGQPLSPDADRFLGSFVFGTKPAAVAKAPTGKPAAAARQASVEWMTVKLDAFDRGKEDRATVEMPNTVRPLTVGACSSDELDGFGCLTMVAESPSADYLIATMYRQKSAPKDRPLPTGEKSLGAARTEGIYGYAKGGKLTSDAPIRSESGEAREYTMMVDRGNAGAVKARGRTYVVGEGVYVLMAFAKAKGKDVPPEATRFLDSLKIKGRGVAKADLAVAPPGFEMPPPAAAQPMLPPAGATAADSFAPVLKLILGPAKTSLLMGVARLGMPRPMGSRPPGMVAGANHPPVLVPSPPPAVAVMPKATKSARPAPKAARMKSWGEEVDPDGDVEIVRKPTTLTMNIPGKAHVLAPERNKMNAPRVVKPIEGHFLASVLVDGEFRPARGSTVKGLSSRVAAGLIIWKDPDNYLVFQHRATADEVDGKDGAVLEEIVGGRKGATIRQAFEGGPMFLRLENNRGKIHASYSADGKAWKYLKPVDADWASATVQVGVIAVSTSPGPHAVMFDDLTIEK